MSSDDDNKERDWAYHMRYPGTYQHFKPNAALSAFYQRKLSVLIGESDRPYAAFYDRDILREYADSLPGSYLSDHTTIYIGQVYMSKEHYRREEPFVLPDYIHTRYWIGYPIDTEFLDSVSKHLEESIFGAYPHWTRMTVEVTAVHEANRGKPCDRFEIGDTLAFDLDSIEYDEKNDYLKASSSNFCCMRKAKKC